MAFPPFPSQDLAKLVLGYLAEEQLMTAYDEFLQASPYLDALRNEFDRIFMTSLKNILAEYRAVKIYVETCKPFILRRRLFQCTNLFEIVKFLVQNIDINKLNSEEQNIDKSSANPSISCNPSISQIEATTLGSSVETTSLDDLPGNITTKKRALKSFDKDQSSAQTIRHSSIDNETKQVTTCSTALSCDNLVPQPVVDEHGLNYVEQKPDNLPADETIKNKKVESVQKIDEFDNILDFVCKNGNETSNRNVQASDIGHQQRISTAGTFQEFTTGINTDNKSAPSASTSTAVNNAQAPLRRNTTDSYVNIGINAADLKPRSPYVLKIGCIKNTQGVAVLTTQLTQLENNSGTLHSNVTREENKIKILSDVKVDKSYEKICPRPKITPLLTNATSTPHVPMSTIVINGTSCPAYRQKPQKPVSFTEDEIMSMPVYLDESTEPQSSSTDRQPRITLPTINSTLTSTTSCAQNILKPLVIDIQPNFNIPVSNCEKNPQVKINQKALNEQSLVRTVEVTGHVSVPKDNSLLTALRTCTPQGLPPKRKSLSTPRRTSHVRVLDFATPRRILHETINEQSSNMSSSAETELKEKADLPSKNKEVEESDKNSTSDKVANTSNVNKKSDATKENKINVNKRKNWDADLRALIVPEITNSDMSTQKTTSRRKSTNSKKKNSANKELDKAKEEKIKSEKKTKKSACNVKDTKNIKAKVVSKEEEDVTCNNQETSTVHIKPNINIITSSEWSTNQESDKSQNKVNVSNDRTDTPESERIAMQNTIGARLNLSDLLETPYKQALYDIQMDTPKYLGPDLPDVPISDVKIMSIPTPRFLCSPKGVQVTPSSYSSRLTDYSGSGSYYNPDCQDYVISTEILEGPLDAREDVMSDKSEYLGKKNEVSIENEVSSKNEGSKLRRPVRQCRKNVSYYNTPNNAKIKESDDDVKHSDSISIDSSLDKADKAINLKKVRDTKRKSESSKKNVSAKKTKSPKTFMKIKPRRSTPVKENLRAKSRKHLESSQNKSQKRTVSKDNSNLTPIVASVPTKSRRKSSTPRKLHCTKTFNSQQSDNVSPESIKSKESIVQDSQVCSHESDIEQLPLRWSDDGSQDGKSQDVQLKPELANDGDDISKIKEYIETSVLEKSDRPKEGDGLHINLVEQGFDFETAKSIERVLIDSPVVKQETPTTIVGLERLDVKNNVAIDGNNFRTISDTSGNLEIVETEDDNDEVEFSVYECNEDTANFINYEYVEVSHTTESQPATLKDKFSMEICIDDGVTVRLRATMFNTLLDQEPKEIYAGYSCEETEIAVSSISHIDKLYTPMKDAKQQIRDIFESTLTSLDTPFKSPSSPKPQEDCEPIITDIEQNIADRDIDVEKVDNKEKPDVKKRKRLQSSTTPDVSPNSIKRPKSDTQYLLKSANIQNIDIESVLSKLHGPGNGDSN